MLINVFIRQLIVYQKPIHYFQNIKFNLKRTLKTKVCFNHELVDRYYS